MTHDANLESWIHAVVCNSKSSLPLSVSWRRGVWGPCCAGWAGSWIWEASGSQCDPPSQKNQRQQVQVGRACSEAAGRAWPCQVPVWTPARLAPPPRCRRRTPSSSAEVCCSTCNTKIWWLAIPYCKILPSFTFSLHICMGLIFLRLMKPGRILLIALFSFNSSELCWLSSKKYWKSLI